VTDAATGDIITASEGELWRELRRRSGLKPREFCIAMARAAGIRIPDVLQKDSDYRRNIGAFDPAENLTQEDINKWLSLTLFRCPIDGKIRLAQIGEVAYRIKEEKKINNGKQHSEK